MLLFNNFCFSLKLNLCINRESDVWSLLIACNGIESSLGRGCAVLLVFCMFGTVILGCECASSLLFIEQKGG